MSAWKSIKLLDGKQIPGIGFGFGTANYAKTGPNGINEELVEQCVQAITMAGYRHIDGAEGYSNETSQGAAIKKSGVPRNELFVTSKISRKESAKDVKATLQNQLKQLGLDHVDLYLVHSPLLGKIPEVWKQMEAVKKEGLATSIGVSNFRRRHLEELIASAEEKPVVNQIEFNPLTIEEAQDVLDCCNEHGIKVAAYSPSSPITKFAGTAVDKATADVAKELSDKTGTSVNPGQVLLKWAQGKGAIVITTSSKTERMKEQVDAGRLPDLTSEQIESIHQAGIKSGIKRIYMTDTV